MTGLGAKCAEGPRNVSKKLNRWFQPDAAPERMLPEELNGAAKVEVDENEPQDGKMRGLL